jgi:hypothetical protein
MPNTIRKRKVLDGVELYTVPFTQRSLEKVKLVAHLSFKNGGWVTKFRQEGTQGWMPRPEFNILLTASRELMRAAQDHIAKLKTRVAKKG